MRNRIVLLVPYYGKVPDYFNLWLASAENNPEFDFYVISDLRLNISNSSNVKLINLSFSLVQKRIKHLFVGSVISSPYKLCDYKPAYGVIFSDLIQGYDFLGYCDVDLIFGKLSSFISDELLTKHDKLFYHGHFTLFRNQEYVNHLFLKKYDKVIDYDYAFHTNYVCHFDENGTVAYAYKYGDIKQYFNWLFYDAPFYSYLLVKQRSTDELFLHYNNGNLYLCNSDNCSEVMYVHLQKRRMIGWQTLDNINDYYILRNMFLIQSDFVNQIQNVDYSEKYEFEKNYRFNYRKNQIKNLFLGAIKFRMKRFRKY